MVQPPPGFRHVKPGCGLPWCPGDFRGVGGEAALANGDGDEGVVKKPMEGTEGYGGGMVEKEEWFLSGFENVV